MPEIKKNPYFSTVSGNFCVKSESAKTLKIARG